ILPQRRLIGLGAGRNVQMLFRERLLLRIDISGQSFPVTVTPQGPNDSLPPASRRRDCALVDPAVFRIRMPSLHSKGHTTNAGPRPIVGRYTVPTVAALALLYALFAGLRTVGDSDIGWCLATGGWIVQHHSIPSTDVLSYTARGQEWIYPALSQVLLYSSFLLGNYSLLSWLGAAACVGTVAILLRRGHATVAVLAVLAVPMIAERTNPRAEMFT